MHNGGISEFTKIKRKLQSKLPDELFNFVTGNTGTFILSISRAASHSETDSQWAFALFLSKVNSSRLQ